MRMIKRLEILSKMSKIYLKKKQIPNLIWACSLNLMSLLRHGLTIMLARHVGFSIHVGRQECSQRTREIISRQFLCFREGSRDKRCIERKDIIRPERPHTRVGCKAMIMVKKRGPNK